MIRHHIRGIHHLEAPVASIEVLMHRKVFLKRWSLRSAANAFWRLYLPISEGGILKHEKSIYPLVPGYVYLISPHTPFDSECSKPFRKWYLHFNAGGLSQSCQAGIVKLCLTTRIRKLIEITCPKQNHLKPSNKHEFHSLKSLELVLLVLQKALPQFVNLSNTESILFKCIEYMQIHMHEKITLAKLARFACKSPRTLSHLFVNGIKHPPMRYLIELRINKAMKLLRHTHLSIDQIAKECGFANRYYFTRMLSKFRKTTPAAFRHSS